MTDAELARIGKIEIARALRYARRLIELSWAQGSCRSPHRGDNCAAQAIVMACRKSGIARYDDVGQALIREAGLPTPYEGASTTQCITIWNDAPERTKLEVVSAFRLAERKIKPKWGLW
jgi:hypothetical protein